jgi:hypothetical protein
MRKKGEIIQDKIAQIIDISGYFKNDDCCFCAEDLFCIFRSSSINNVMEIAALPKTKIKFSVIFVVK